MNNEHVKAILLLANLEAISIDSEENPYWGSPSTTAFNKETYEWAGPRWLINIKDVGLVKIHLRKHVFNIDWESTKLRFPIEDQFGRDYIDTDKQLTRDQVTQGPTHVHADSFGKCIEYLQFIKRAVERDTYLRDFRRRAALGLLTEDEIGQARYCESERQAKQQLTGETNA